MRCDAAAPKNIGGLGHCSLAIGLGFCPRRGDDQGMPGGPWGTTAGTTNRDPLYTDVHSSTRPYHLSMKVSETPRDVTERRMLPLFCTIGRLFILRCLPCMCDASVCSESGVRHHVSLPHVVSALPPARARPSRQHPPTSPSPAISWHLVPWLCQASSGTHGQATRS